MIDFVLKQNRVERYRHAARHFAECASLASAIGDFAGFEPHERYIVRLKPIFYSSRASTWHKLLILFGVG